MSAYIAPSQIAQRQLEYFNGKHVLVAGEVEDMFPLELTAHCESVEVFTSNYSYFRQIRHSDKIKAILVLNLMWKLKPTCSCCIGQKRKQKPNICLPCSWLNRREHGDCGCR